MKKIRGMVLVGMILLLGGGCTSRPAEQVSVAGTGGANGSLFGNADSRPSHQDTLYTAMLPRDAAVAAAGALFNKFGMQVGSGGSYFQGFIEQSFEGDHFSANAMAKTSAGGSIQINGEWIKDGETKVGLTSDLPDAQYEAVVAVIRSAIGATDKK
jgi:hypothetical protein